VRARLQRSRRASAWSATIGHWTAVDEYLCARLVPPDAATEAALAASEAAGLPPHASSPNQGKLLELLVRSHGARRVLELGTLGAYGTIWLARGLAPGGRLVTLEFDPRCAEVARANIAAAGLAEVVELREGPALQTLPELVAEGAEPFDLIFIDADKENYPNYLEWSLKLARPGSLIVIDNVVLGGAIVNADAIGAWNEGPEVRGVRRMYELLAAEPRLDATAIQTVGDKGHDGFILGLVTDGRPAG
jgi:predicted O-methyltransferase YrrM